VSATARKLTNTKIVSSNPTQRYWFVNTYVRRQHVHNKIHRSVTYNKRSKCHPFAQIHPQMFPPLVDSRDIAVMQTMPELHFSTFMTSVLLWHLAFFSNHRACWLNFFIHKIYVNNYCKIVKQRNHRKCYLQFQFTNSRSSISLVCVDDNDYKDKTRTMLSLKLASHNKNSSWVVASSTCSVHTCTPISS